MGLAVPVRLLQAELQHELSLTDCAAAGGGHGRRGERCSGPGHWESPIVIDGEIILPEGNANHRATKGVLDIWSLPSGEVSPSGTRERSRR